MENIVGIILCVAALVAAAYAQLKIAGFTNTRSKLVFTRVLLLTVGVAFGFVSSLYMAATPQKITMFLTAFGLVHVPAAIILLLKERRGERRS